MRVAILLLGLFGGIASGVAGGVWYVYFFASKATVEMVENDQQIPQKEKDTLRAIAHTSFQTAPFFFVSALFGFIGGLLGVMGHFKSGGSLMLVSALGPPVMALNSPLMLEPFMLGGLSLFAIGGILGFVARARPAPGRADEED